MSCDGVKHGVTTPSSIRVDLRESLANDRLTGPVSAVQLPAERITRLHGILFDLDPKLLISDNPFFRPDCDPKEFSDNIRPVLDRHPLARHAEVRVSGTGLHLILCLDPAVELTSAGDQARWSAIVKVVQRTLPVDPDAPGITALTRPLGSVNSKNGAVVDILKPGEPVTPEAVEQYVARLSAAPFKEIALPLLGAERISPCPFCLEAGTRLDLLNQVGKCYGGCSRVSMEQVFDRILKPVEAPASQT